MRKLKKLSAFKKRKEEKKPEISSIYKDYKENLEGSRSIDIIEEVESESGTDREENIYVIINYCVDKENKLTLDGFLQPKDETYPISTERIDVGVKRADDYTKCVSAIKALPNSSKRISF
jgi:hypothetical protein